jgi:hypothetical protein
MVLIELLEVIPLIQKFPNCWRIGGSCKLFSILRRSCKRKPYFPPTSTYELMAHKGGVPDLMN